MARKKQVEDNNVVRVEKYTLIDFDLEWFLDCLKENGISYNVEDSKIHKCKEVSVNYKEGDDKDIVYRFFHNMKH